MNKAAPSLLLIPALLAVKLPWMLLQVFAWGFMASDHFQETGSVSESFRLTFSPEYRCGICKSIDAAQETQPGTGNTLAPADVVLLLPNLAAIQIPQPESATAYHMAGGFSPQWMDTATSPPPRA